LGPLTTVTSLQMGSNGIDGRPYVGQPLPFHGIPGPADAGQVVAPTALEAWASCPHAYFVKRLLRVEPPPDTRRPGPDRR
jgi:hypothetical protein